MDNTQNPPQDTYTTYTDAEAASGLPAWRLRNLFPELWISTDIISHNVGGRLVYAFSAYLERGDYYLSIRFDAEKRAYVLRWGRCGQLLIAGERYFKRLRAVIAFIAQQKQDIFPPRNVAQQVA